MLWLHTIILENIRFKTNHKKSKSLYLKNTGLIFSRNTNKEEIITSFKKTFREFFKDSHKDVNISIQWFSSLLLLLPYYQKRPFELHTNRFSERHCNTFSGTEFPTTTTESAENGVQIFTQKRANIFNAPLVFPTEHSIIFSAAVSASCDWTLFLQWQPFNC